MDLEFYRQYLLALDSTREQSRYSFLLGYFIHLICDNLWSLWIVVASQTLYKKQIQASETEAWQAIRKDWHDLDRKQFRDYPDRKIWQLMRTLSRPPNYLSYLPPEAMSQQLEYIEHSYLVAEHGRELDRRYPYLNEASMDRFVNESTQVVLEILQQRDKLAQLNEQTALSLLPPERLLPYEYPLGDVPGRA